MPSPGLTIFGMAGNYAARRSGIVRGRTVGTQQIAFAAASNGERAPNLARIDQEWPSLAAERGEHPDSAENEHHNEHDGDDDQDRLDHNRICMPVRASAPSAPRFLSMRSCAPLALHWLYPRCNAEQQPAGQVPVQRCPGVPDRLGRRPVRGAPPSGGTVQCGHLTWPGPTQLKLQ